MALLPAASAVLPRASEWLALGLSYLLGAVPFGWALARALRGVDLRKIGSGNIGATNAMRALGVPLGLLALALDLAKGYVPVALFARALDGDGGLAREHLSILCAAAAVCGHVWPLYLRFRGGKAVATGTGALLALDPLCALGGGVAWLVAMALTRYMGLSSMVMALAFPLVAGVRAWRGAVGVELVLATLALAALIVVRHRANIARMRAGLEPRVARRPAERHGR